MKVNKQGGIIEADETEIYNIFIEKKWYKDMTFDDFKAYVKRTGCIIHENIIVIEAEEVEK